MGDNATNLVGESILARKVQQLEAEVTRLLDALEVAHRRVSRGHTLAAQAGLEKALAAAQEGE